MPPMTPQEFVAKWQRANLSERSAYQQHFLDLCALLGQPTPAAADPDGGEYTFERGVTKTTGGQGWADVWMRGHFGWEYKGKHKDLAEAYQQLLSARSRISTTSAPPGSTSPTAASTNPPSPPTAGTPRSPTTNSSKNSSP
jgi:hypothetical protein